MASTRGQGPALPCTDLAGILDSQRSGQLQDPEPRVKGLQMNMFTDVQNQPAKTKRVLQFPLSGVVVQGFDHVRALLTLIC